MYENFACILSRQRYAVLVQNCRHISGGVVVVVVGVAPAGPISLHAPALWEQTLGKIGFCSRWHRTRIFVCGLAAAAEQCWFITLALFSRQHSICRTQFVSGVCGSRTTLSRYVMQTNKIKIDTHFCTHTHTIRACQYGAQGGCGGWW